MSKKQSVRAKQDAEFHQLLAENQHDPDAMGLILVYLEVIGGMGSRNRQHVSSAIASMVAHRMPWMLDRVLDKETAVAS
ncbi:MAG: hypothetical protein AB7T06_40590 [Kofleriaceae bacterium]